MFSSRIVLFFLICPTWLFAAPPVPVTTVITKKIMVDQTLNSIGSLESDHTMVISAETDGRIDQILSAAGENVKKGQLLAHIANPQAPAAQAGAIANLEKAAIACKTQQDIVNKIRNLVKLGTYPQIRLITEQEKLSMLQADLHAAKLNANSVTNINDFSNVVSPVNGVIQQKKVYLNMIVATGTPLFIIAYDNHLHAVLPFSQDERDFIAIGMPIKLHISSKNSSFIYAKVSGVEPIIDTVNRSFNVIADIQNPSSWYPGMSVEGQVIIAKKEVIQLPLMAVIYFDNQPYVFVIDQKAIAKKVPVQVEIATDKAFITQGLNAGERVVLEGANDLNDGDKVILQ